MIPADYAQVEHDALTARLSHTAHRRWFYRKEWFLVDMIPSPRGNRHEIDQWQAQCDGRCSARAPYFDALNALFVKETA